MWEAAVIITMAAPGIAKVAVAMSPVQNHLGTTLIHTKAITAHTNTGIMIQNQPLAAAVTIVKKATTKKATTKKFIANKATTNKILSNMLPSLIMSGSAPRKVHLG